jgi:hypothetical protein
MPYKREMDRKYSGLKRLAFIDFYCCRVKFRLSFLKTLTVIIAHGYRRRKLILDAQYASKGCIELMVYKPLDSKCLVAPAGRRKRLRKPQKIIQ